jgi:hypothetical protein
MALGLVLDRIGDMREADPQGALSASLEQLDVARRLEALYPKESFRRVVLALVLVKVAVRSDDATPYLGEARALTQELEGRQLPAPLLPWLAVLKRFVAVPQADD